MLADVEPMLKLLALWTLRVGNRSGSRPNSIEATAERASTAALSGCAAVATRSPSAVTIYRAGSLVPG